MCFVLKWQALPDRYRKRAVCSQDIQHQEVRDLDHAVSVSQSAKNKWL
jgi:hypothetical protein